MTLRAKLSIKNENNRSVFTNVSDFTNDPSTTLPYHYLIISVPLLYSIISVPLLYSSRKQESDRTTLFKSFFKKKQVFPYYF